MTAPVLLFIYNRPEHTKRTLEALAENTLAGESELLIFADGPKPGADAEEIGRIERTRRVARERAWCGSVTVFESGRNKGLAASIIGGVTRALGTAGRALVLEDDIGTGRRVLSFMNEALERYKDDKAVWHVTGWRDPVRARGDSAFFSRNMECWGWATWADRWRHFEKDPRALAETFTPEMIRRFNMDGSEPGNWWQVEENLAGRMDTWAIFWNATIFLNGGLCLGPTKSLVRNIGFDNSGVHCGKQTAQAIRGPIDWNITRFPKKTETDEDEYEKSKEFKRRMNGMRPTPAAEKLRRRMKRTLKKSRAFRWLHRHTLGRPRKPLGYIFMLHRVDEIDEGRLRCNENMKVSPAFLERQLARLKRRYDIIPLADVRGRLQKKSRRQFVVFTMDDGYKDNLTKALPLFKKHNAPYTIFVTTDFPDRSAVLWWYELEDILLARESVTLSNGTTYPARTAEEKCDSFLRIREEILKLDQLDLENELNRLFAPLKVDWSRQCETLCLSWDDIRKLKGEPLVTIGAHTKHHHNLRLLASADDVRDEVRLGAETLKAQADIDCTVFAYPFGTPSEAGEREHAVLAEFPFACSCMAFGGACTAESARNIHALPRIMFTEDFSEEDLK